MTLAANEWEAAMRREDYPAAWRIAEAVLAARDPATRDHPSLPYHQRWVWDGRELAGKDVLVRCYHGLGDTLQFVRFLPNLRSRASRVTLEVQPELAELLASAPGADRVIPFDVNRPAPSVCDIEIMELPHALRVAPASAAYLKPPPGGGGKGLIGICWQAGDWDPARSVPPQALAAILPPNVVSLQRGAPAISGVPDALCGDMNIAATARLVASLDHVISVDTMIAHLAGALGRPVSLLLHHAADWRWGDAERTQWYPATRIFRQAEPGDWSRPLAELEAALRRYISS